ncbi:hypothetical protein M422DRAFT_24590 [Sphaerobolus stellatus SS14]|nr:hypothetical protein M422DRAFT_24590 [Sphaerobolus stellatus SS14]
MSASSPDVLALIANENVIIYNMVASSVFLFWDYCITFSEEVKLIWSKKIGYVSILFLGIRYFTLCVKILHLVFYTDALRLIHATPISCEVWAWFEALAGHFTYFMIEVLLIMRIYAFYERNRILLVTLVTLLIIEHAPSFVFLGLTLPHFKFLPNPFPPQIHASACIITFLPKLFADYWAPGFAFQAILFLLLIYKFIHTKLKTTISTSRLLTVFVRDGAWAFVIIFAILLWNQLAFIINPQGGEVALGWLFSVFGFCGTRLVLNLRVAADKVIPTFAGDTIPLTPVSPVSPSTRPGSFGGWQQFSYYSSEPASPETPLPKYGINVQTSSYTEAI